MVVIIFVFFVLLYSAVRSSDNDNNIILYNHVISNISSKCACVYSLCVCFYVCNLFFNPSPSHHPVQNSLPKCINAWIFLYIIFFIKYKYFNQYSVVYLRYIDKRLIMRARRGLRIFGPDTRAKYCSLLKEKIYYFAKYIHIYIYVKQNTYIKCII